MKGIHLVLKTLILCIQQISIISELQVADPLAKYLYPEAFSHCDYIKSGQEINGSKLVHHKLDWASEQNTERMGCSTPHSFVVQQLIGHRRMSPLEGERSTTTATTHTVSWALGTHHNTTGPHPDSSWRDGQDKEKNTDDTVNCISSGWAQKTTRKVKLAFLLLPPPSGLLFLPYLISSISSFFPSA